MSNRQFDIQSYVNATNSLIQEYEFTKEKIDNNYKKLMEKKTCFDTLLADASPDIVEKLRDIKSQMLTGVDNALEDEEFLKSKRVELQSRRETIHLYLKNLLEIYVKLTNIFTEPNINGFKEDNLVVEVAGTLYNCHNQHIHNNISLDEFLDSDNGEMQINDRYSELNTNNLNNIPQEHVVACNNFSKYAEL